MKLRNLLASVAACAIAVSAMAISASAAITNPNTDEGKYAYDVLANLPAGCAVTDVYGAEFTFTGFDEAAGTGGGFVWNSSSINWDQVEWGDAGSGKPLTFTADNLTVRRLEDAPIFAADDEYAQVVIAQWDGWGVDITINSVTLLDQNGNALQAAPTTDAPAGDNDSTNTTTNSNGTQTGDAGIALAVAGLAVAGAAAYVARKKD